MKKNTRLFFDGSEAFLASCKADAQRLVLELTEQSRGATIHTVTGVLRLAMRAGLDSMLAEHVPPEVMCADGSRSICPEGARPFSDPSASTPPALERPEIAPDLDTPPW
jgi:hypothetical protein